MKHIGISNTFCAEIGLEGKLRSTLQTGYRRYGYGS
jgi:hypothetical protein